MRFRSSMSVAFCVFAVGLGAVGCSSGNSSSSSNAPATTSPANSPSTTQAGAGTSAPASTATATQAATQQPQPAASGGTCQPANLSFTFGAKTGATTQPTQVVDLTNQGTSACTMDGFPGVDLVGVADGQQNYTWPLVRASVSYSKVTLQPGGTAHFGLTYLPGTSGDGSTLISVTKLVITPPNDYTHAELTWNQDIVLQDAATHPGTYITPVAAGS